MRNLLFGVTLASALGCGLVAGVFFAFSSFVMKALARLPAPQGIAAMQSINIVVINPWFLGVFLGTAAACLFLIVAMFIWERPDGIYMGSLLYLVGTIGVTRAFNIPRNDALARVDPTSAEGARLWANYVTSWTAWNHVRTVAALAAAAWFTIILCR
jgi:uncharacterized membrane protein